MLKHIASLLVVFFVSQMYVQAQQTVGLFEHDSETFIGYTLFSPSAATETYLIDNCGRLVHSWPGTNRPGSSTYLLENGDILRAVRLSSSYFAGGGIGGAIERVDWDGNLIWTFEYASMDVHHHHDMALLPNGNVLLIAWELKTQEEALAAGRNPSMLGDELWPDHIVEIEPVGTNGGNIVWEWHFWDHLIQDFDPSKANYGVVADHPELVDINYLGSVATSTGADWNHCNAINYNAERDEIMLSSRHLNEIYIIDHSTTTEEAAGHTGGNSGKGGDILYRYGNPLAYQRGTIDDQKSFGQHDAHWIKSGLPDEGKVLFYNNGINRPQGVFSTVDIIELPLDSDGHYFIEPNEPFGPDELSWTYVADTPTDLYSSIISGAQRLPNGNTLICEGATGKFIEVNQDGVIHWHYKNPVGIGGQPTVQGDNPIFNAVFRAYRYAPDYPAFDGRDLTPGEVIELEPLPFNCTLEVSVEDLAIAKKVEVYPNPFQDHITVRADQLIQGELALIDALGRKMFTTYVNSNEIQIELKSLHAGIYFLELPNKNVVKLICYP